MWHNLVEHSLRTLVFLECGILALIINRSLADSTEGWLSIKGNQALSSKGQEHWGGQRLNCNSANDVLHFTVYIQNYRVYNSISCIYIYSYICISLLNKIMHPQDIRRPHASAVVFAPFWLPLSSPSPRVRLRDSEVRPLNTHSESHPPSR